MTFSFILQIGWIPHVVEKSWKICEINFSLSRPVKVMKLFKNNKVMEKSLHLELAPNFFFQLENCTFYYDHWAMIHQLNSVMNLTSNTHGKVM